MTAGVPTVQRTQSLTPAQQEVVDLLGASRADWPEHDPGLRDALRRHLDLELAALAPRLPQRGLHLSKHALSSIHGCEVRHLHEEAERREGSFTWSPPLARGSVVHKAVELSAHRFNGAPPLQLVDEAMERLAETDQSLGEWLRDCTEVERAELRAAAGEVVGKFVETWPPLKVAWRPATEARIRVELCEGRIVLRGTTDLTLGQAQGSRAGKVIVDFKTGGTNPAHVDDLRYYALIDTLRTGVPPRLLVSAYLDQGTLRREEVAEPHLVAAMSRVIDAVHRVVELAEGLRTPAHRPGPPCRWCPLSSGCDPGTRWLTGEQDDLPTELSY